MEKIKINCPDGYEVDRDKSTFEEIVFKPKKLDEYWECVTQRGEAFTIGKIYKINNKGTLTCDNGYICEEKYTGGVYYNYYEFKPSTKEAFEAQDKPKFEVGKWYQLGDWRIKFVAVKGKRFYGSFFITPYDGYVNPNYDHLDLDSYKPILMTDLSEIQQYLPDGHPDKIIKYTLEEGEYYKITQDDFWIIGKVSEGNNYNNDLFSKIMNLRGDRYYMINSEAKYFTHGSWCYYSEYEGKITRNFAKLSKGSDEVKWLEACNKAGKYLTKEEALKPKLPTKWEEVDNYDGIYTDGVFYGQLTIIPKYNNIVGWPTEEYAKASIALCKLIRLRDIYNGGWKPDWSDETTPKHTLYYAGEIIDKTDYLTIQKVLSFKTRELRDEFLKNFKDLIEDAKLLL